MKKEDVYLTLKNKRSSTSNIYLLAKSFGPFQLSVDLRKIIALETSHKRHRFSHYFYIVGGYNFNRKSNSICWRVKSDQFVRHIQKDFNEQSKLVQVAKAVSLIKNFKAQVNEEIKTPSLYEKQPNFPDEELEDYRIVAVGTLIYVIGGVYYETLDATNFTWIYDTREKLWKQGANMKQKRYSLFARHPGLWCSNFFACYDKPTEMMVKIRTKFFM